MASDGNSISTSNDNESFNTNDPSSSIHKTNIKVCVRVRPLNVRRHPYPSTSITTPTRRRGSGQVVSSNHIQKRRQLAFQAQEQEAQDPVVAGDASVCAWVVKDHVVSQAEETNPDYTRVSDYALDYAYDGSCSTSGIYHECIRPIVMATLDGYHGSVFAYGQTSTGKTYTMQGNKKDSGIVPLAVQDCFRYIAENKEHNREFLLRVSYLEIYNEQIYDLLHPGAASVGIRIFESKTEGVIIRGLKEEVVVSPDQIFALIAAGEAQRHVGSTSMNEHSSRSHTIFRLLIESKDLSAGKSRRRSVNGKRVDPVRVSCLSLVDLAGSECIKDTKATGLRKTEGRYINKSLSTLGHVIFKLSEISRTGTKDHIPYRDSKLTRLLQPSLSGNAQVAVVCTISPLSKHIDESHNTLKFATRAKRIKQEASVTEVIDDNTLLQQYREEIESLKQRLKESEEQKNHSADTNGVDDEDTQETIRGAIHNLERLILHCQDYMKNPYPFESPSREGASNTASETNDEDDKSIKDQLEELKGCLESALKPKKNMKVEVGFITPPRKSLAKRFGVESESTTNQDTSGRKENGTLTLEEQVENLTRELREQKIQMSLHKADNEFLQKQLEEKEKILLEIGDVLETVEKKQLELEEENRRLKAELEKV